MMNLREKLQEQTATKLNKDKEVVKRVTDSIFEFLVDSMREEKYEPYRIQGLGVFEVKPYIKKKSERAKKCKEEKEEYNRNLYNSLGSGSTSESNVSKDGEVDSGQQEENIL
jgi:nucleoid DNA-binding protein